MLRLMVRNVFRHNHHGLPLTRPFSSLDKQVAVALDLSSGPRTSSKLNRATENAPFVEFGLPQALVTHLAAMGFERATRIQTAALPSTLARKDTIVAAETGSGKTLVYLLPILARVAKQGISKHGTIPRAIVLAPSQELVIQICAVYDALNVVPGFSSAPVIRGFNLDAARLAKAALIVATPKALQQLLDKATGSNLTVLRDAMKDVRSLCIDEADTMLSPSHRPGVEQCIQLIQRYQAADPASLQLSSNDFELGLGSVNIVAVGATFLEKFSKHGTAADKSSSSFWLHKHLKHANYIASNQLHSLNKDIELYEVNIRGSHRGASTEEEVTRAFDTRIKAVLRVLEKDVNVLPKTELAVLPESKRSDMLPYFQDVSRDVMDVSSDPSTGETVLKLKPLSADQDFLHATQEFQNVDVAEYEAEIEDAEGSNNATLIFVSEAPTAEYVADEIERHFGISVGRLHKNIPLDARIACVNAWNEGEFGVMVATDLAARGLDTTNVEHVIQFDAPTDATTFIHRAGRTARAGRSGKVSTLLFEHERPKYMEILESLRHGAQSAVARRRNAGFKARRASRG